jgi:hypothetical protein
MASIRIAHLPMVPDNAVPPAITALAFWLLGSISGPRLSEIWLLLGWLFSLVIAALVALGCDKRRSRSKPPTEG